MSKVTNPPGLSFPIYENQTVSKILTTVALLEGCAIRRENLCNITFLLRISG